MRGTIAAIAAALALSSLAAAGVAQERGAAGEPRAGADYAARGTIAEAPKEGAKTLSIGVGRSLTVVLDLEARFDLRIDKVARPGKSPASLFRKGARAAVFGRPTRMSNAAGAGFRSNVIPLALVLGEGFEPANAGPPPTSATFGGDPKWFVGPVDRFEPPDGLWIGLNGDCHVPVAPELKVLTTALHDGSKALVEPDLRKLLAKGQAVRLVGKVSHVAKPGGKTEARLAPKRLVLLDASFPSYDPIDKAEEGS